MKWLGILKLLASLFVISTFGAGCTTAGRNQVMPSHSNTTPPPPILGPRPSQLGNESAINQVNFEDTPESNRIDSDPNSATLPLVRNAELMLEHLVQQVLARNPSLAEMTAAWQAAIARYPQAISLDDPVLGTAFGPGSFGSNQVGFAYKLELSQKLPFPGKRGLRGEQALAEAGAARNDVDDIRLGLIEAAKSAFYDYYLVDRALEVNEENLKRLKEAKENAESRVKNNLAPQQELLQANVEIAKQQERDLLLRRIRQVGIARINTLMHLPPDSPLPPAAKRIQISEPPGDVKQLRTLALGRRPDIQALSNLLAADQAALGLAVKEFRPDFAVTAAYDAFWQERPLRTMVGVEVDLPVRRARRFAGVSEARARIAQRQARLDRLADEVNFQVQQAYEQLRESESVVRLYEKTTLPAAEANVKEALAAYANGKIPFLSLIEAQRSLIGLRDKYFESLADYFRRRATLERVVGGPLDDK